MYTTPSRAVRLVRIASAALAACTTAVLFSAVAALAGPQQSALWALDRTRHQAATHPIELAHAGNARNVH